MGREFGDLFGSLVGAAIIVTGLLLAAVIITPLFLIGIAGYVAVRLWYESPARAERMAHEETMRLYHHARAGSVELSDAEIDAALSDRWPSTTPEQLRVQLLELGRKLYADEGLSPDIPPPPTLCNTVEGGRYRDLLAKQGQARNDRTMLVSALAVISEALAPIARAAPPMQGDVLVSVQQFVTPLGPTIDQVITPFFQDNGYG